MGCQVARHFNFADEDSGEQQQDQEEESWSRGNEVLCSQDSPSSCGPRICFQSRPKIRVAIQEAVNESFHLCRVVKVPMAQAVKRTFPAGI